MCVWMINVNLKEHFHVTDMKTVVGWMHECMNAWMHACMNEWMNDWINEWLNQWMIEWMNEWIDEWINELRNVSCHFPLNPKETQATESHLDTCLMCHRELWRTYDLPLFLFHRGKCTNRVQIPDMVLWPCSTDHAWPSDRPWCMSCWVSPLACGSASIPPVPVLGPGRVGEKDFVKNLWHECHDLTCSCKELCQMFVLTSSWKS